jgi:hypothetical protein
MRYLERHEEAFCIIEAEGYQRLGQHSGRFFPVMAQQEFDRTTLLLISNRW